MDEKVRCGTCGNLLPSWAHSCPVCQNMAKAAKKYHTSNPRPAWQKYPAGQSRTASTDKKTPPNERHVEFSTKPMPRASSKKETKSKSRVTSPSTATSELMTQFEALNRLLEDMYGEPKRVSGILREHRIRGNSIETWRSSERRMKLLFDSIEDMLYSMLTTAFPEFNAQILNKYYGLSMTRQSELGRLSSSFNLRREDVANVLESYVKFLRKRENQATFERGILAAAAKIANKEIAN